MSLTGLWVCSSQTWTVMDNRAKGLMGVGNGSAWLGGTEMALCVSEPLSHGPVFVLDTALG